MMGDSAGRSKGHRVAPDAPRRATPRERQLVDPPWDRRVSRFEKLTLPEDRRYLVVLGLFWLAGVATGALVVGLFP